MADQPKKAAAKKKRMVKNPETFRERAQKAAKADSQPKRSIRFLSVGDKVTSPARRFILGVYGSKPLTPLRKVLRAVSKIIFPKYFRQSWQELKLVTWPSLKESRRLTFAVLIFAVVFGAAIAGVDWVLDKIFRHLLIT